MEKYFKIGEISKLYGIGVDSLRYYEEIGIIAPHRAKSGYRLYSTRDIWRLNVIRELRELGFPMKKIKEHLASHSVDSTVSLLTLERDAIDEKIKELSELRKSTQKRLNTIKEAQELELGTISLKNYPERSCFLTGEGYKDDNEMDVLIKSLLNLNKDKFYVIGNNQIGTVIPLDKFKESEKLYYKSVFIIDENGDSSLPGGEYLTVSYNGEYSKSRELAKKLLSYCEKNGLSPCGDFLELLWIDIHTSENTDEHITELQLPVKRK